MFDCLNQNIKFCQMVICRLDRFMCLILKAFIFFLIVPDIRAVRFSGWSQFNRSNIVDKLAKYFFDHLFIDFEGALDLNKLRELLDDSPESINLLAKLQKNEDVNEFIFALTEALKDNLETGIDVDLLVEEFKIYANS
jgi:hypothetical protein